MLGRLPRRPGLTLPSALLLLGMLTELMWVYPWFVRVGESQHWALPPLSLGASAFLAGAAALLTRAGLASKMNVARMRIVVMGSCGLLLGVLLLLGVHRAINPANASLWTGGLCFGTYLIWRGVNAGADTPSFDVLYRRFLIGLVGVAVLLRVWVGSGGAITAYVAAYFSCALVSLALLNIQSIQSDLARQVEGGRLLTQRWIPMLLAVVLGIILLAVGIASVFSPGLATSFGHGLGVVYRALITVVLYVIIYPLSFVVVAFGYALKYVLFLFFHKPKPQPSTTSPGDLKKAIEDNNPGLGISQGWLDVIHWSTIAIIVLIVVAGIAFAIYRSRRAKEEDEIEEVSESVGSWQAVKTDLLAILMAFFGRFRRRKAPAVALAGPPAAALEGALSREFTVRELYQGLLYEGEKWGVTRETAETPYEYEGRLNPRVTAPADLDTLTQAYVAERYGGAPPNAEQLTGLNQLWRRLRNGFRGAAPPTDVYGRPTDKV